MDAAALKHNLARRLKGGFLRNVLTVATGSAAAQAVTLAFTPITTRLYGPEAYGLQGLFFSVVALLGTAAALGYPAAMILPRDDAQAVGIGWLSLYVGIAVSGIVALLFLIASDPLLALLNAEALGDFVLLIPLAMFISVVANVQGQWLIRKKAFGFSAKYGIYRSFALGGAKVGLGLIYPSGILLIAANLVGQVTGALLTNIGWRKSQKQVPKAEPLERQNLLVLARTHKDFALLRTPQSFINAFSRNLPLILLSTYFGMAAAGQYSLALSVLIMPASLIGQSVMSVFYPRINDAIHNGEDARALIVKATLGMAATGIAPFALVIAFGPFLFRVAFGEAWGVAGQYAQWLSGWVFFQFINRPAVSAIPALRVQGGLLVYELFSTGTKILALWLGFAVFHSALVAVALFSVLGILAYIWLILWVIRRSAAGAIAKTES